MKNSLCLKVTSFLFLSFGSQAVFAQTSGSGGSSDCLACGSQKPAATAATAEGNDRAFVNWQFRNLRDPDSAKWARYRDPYRANIVLKRGLLGKQSWTGDLACYRMNAKNAYGAYTGYTEYAVLISADGSSMVWEGMPQEDRGTYRSYGQQIIDNYC